jgi:hypothetical protein
LLCSLPAQTVLFPLAGADFTAAALLHGKSGTADFEQVTAPQGNQEPISRSGSLSADNEPFSIASPVGGTNAIANYLYPYSKMQK